MIVKVVFGKGAVVEQMLKKLEEKKQRLDAFRPLPPALVKNLDEWFNVELAYTSNAIEGNTLTRSETALVIEKGLTVAGKSVQEHLEATNHALAFEFIKQLVDKKTGDIALQDILEIHRVILKGIDDEHAGKLRKVAVKIAGSTVTLQDPIKVPDLMDAFIVWLQKVSEHPIKVSADAHLKFVTIHPFVDGNGRTARLLMNLILIQHGYPPAIIRKEDRSAYIDSIEKAQLKDDESSFYQIIFDAVDRSLDMYLEAAEKSI